MDFDYVFLVLTMMPLLSLSKQMGQHGYILFYFHHTNKTMLGVFLFQPGSFTVVYVALIAQKKTTFLHPGYLYPF